MKITHVPEWLDPKSDITFEETYDLPGPHLGICTAINIRAHTWKGSEFLERLQRGGEWESTTVYPRSQVASPISVLLLLKAAFQEGIKANSYMREDKPSKYFKLMERHLGKPFVKKARGKGLGPSSEN